jgi:hypothetical protein
MFTKYFRYSETVDRVFFLKARSFPKDRILFEKSPALQESRPETRFLLNSISWILDF